MPSTKIGSKKLSTSISRRTIDKDQAKKLIQMLVVGVDQAELAEYMAEWTEPQKAQGWQLAAEYFSECANFTPELELGKAIARLNMLFKNSAAIQDFKACLAIQKEINKLLQLHAG